MTTPQQFNVTEKYASGDSYEGSVIRRVQLDAQQPSTSSADDKTPVTSVTTVKHGFGRYTFADGSYYSGEWNNGAMEGKGVFFEASTGDRFDGVWQSGRRVQGVYKYGANGDMYIGGFDLETGSKKTGPSLVLDDCVLYKAIYAEDRLIKRELVLLPVHKDWLSLAGGSQSRYMQNANRYEDPNKFLMHRSTKSDESRDVGGGSFSSSAGMRAGSPTRVNANTTTPTNGSSSSLLRNRSPSPQQQQQQQGNGMARGGSPTRRSTTHVSAVTVSSPAVARRATSPVKPNGATGGRIITTVGGYRSNNTMPSPITPSHQQQQQQRASSPNAAGSYTNLHSNSVVGIHEHYPNHTRGECAVSPTGRLVGAGPVTVGVAPNLRTRDRCESPTRQEQFSQLYTAVKVNSSNNLTATGSSSMLRHNGVNLHYSTVDANGNYVPAAIAPMNPDACTLGGNNSYYEDVTSPDHPIGQKLLVEQQRQMLREMGVKSPSKLLLKHNNTSSNNKSGNNFSSSSSSFAKHNSGAQQEEHDKADREAAAGKEGGSAEAPEVGDNADNNDGQPSVGATAADGDGGSAAPLTPEEALDAARAVLRQRRIQIEENKQHEAQQSTGIHPAPFTTSGSGSGSGSAIPPALVIQQHQEELSAQERSVQPVVVSRKSVPDFRPASPTAQLLRRGGAGVGGELVVSSSVADQQQFGSFHESVNNTNNDSFSHQHGGGGGGSFYSNGRDVMSPTQLSSQHGGGGGGVLTVTSPAAVVGGTRVSSTPQQLMRNGSLVMAPPNPRSATCRSLSTSSFGNLQRGRAQHVDDVTQSELRQAYRYFNTNTTAKY